MKRHQRILLHLPPIMAATFAAFTLCLLWNLHFSQSQLKDAIDTRLIAESQRRAAVASYFVSDLRQSAQALADSHEINAYFTNRALGMSPRYGLNTNLDLIERSFHKQMNLKRLSEKPVFSSITLFNEFGQSLVEVGELEHRHDAFTQSAPTVELVSDLGRTLIVASAPVIFKDGFSGTVVTTIDPHILSTLLIADVEASQIGSGLQELLITSRGTNILPHDQHFLPTSITNHALAELPEGKLIRSTRINPRTTPYESLILLRMAISGLPLSIVTVMPERSAYGQLASSVYSYGLGGLAFLLLLAALSLEKMRSRAVKLQIECSESDRHRSELRAHNERLSLEIARREGVEAELNKNTLTLDNLNANLRVAAAAFDAQEGMVITNADKVILRVNRAFCRMTGYTPDEIVGRTPDMPNPHGHVAEFLGEMYQAVRSTGSWQGEISDQTKNGEMYTRWLTVSSVKNDDDEVTHYIGTYYDISERKNAEERIKELAFFDQLTGLPNRALLLDRLRQVINTNQRSGSYSALLFIDLDDFKTLNDTLGHDMGDLLLKQAAQRLTGCVRVEDTVARFGGDEFVVLLSCLSFEESNAAVCTEGVAIKILSELNKNYQLAGFEHPGACSIGVTLFADNHQSLDELLKRADLAMYEAKSAGRNAIRFFDPKMQILVAARVELESDLREALKEKQFTLHYQAQINCEGRLLGAEALLRWTHPERGPVPPSEFIPVAESSGIILAIGNWVLEAACQQLAIWATRKETADFCIAVNISAIQIHHKDFVARVLETLDRTGADPRHLKLELTESLLVKNVDDIIFKMSTLKAKGVSFSLDDFGTGYSSLSYLKLLPLEQLKIDRSFVRDVLTDPNDSAIARMIVVLGLSLGLEVIAEGVETEPQRAFLESLGCLAYQGYLFSRPLPIGSFEQFAKEHLRSVHLSQVASISHQHLPLVLDENAGIVPSGTDTPRLPFQIDGV